MPTYYVSANGGSDANNGLGPDASHATNKPWATIGKALGAAGISSGDLVYLAPGTYRETVTVAMASATVETGVVGDWNNLSGFKDGSGVRIEPGEVIWSGYTGGDMTTPSTSSLIAFAGRDFLSFRYITFVGSNASPTINADTASSVNINFYDCAFLPGRASACNYIGVTATAGVPLNWIVDRCVFLGVMTRCLSITLPTGSDTDYNVQIRNCLAWGPSNTAVVGVLAGGAGAGGGVDVQHCTAMVGNGTLMTTAANISTANPCTVEGCLVISSATALSAATLGQIIEDKNYLFATTPRTNVAVGAGSQVGPTYAMLLEAGQNMMRGGLPRPMLSPMIGSPLAGFGTAAGAPSHDLLWRLRPAGGQSTLYAVGAFERHNTAGPGGAANADGGSGDCWKMTGPSDQDLFVAVDAVPTTISIKQKTSGYGGTLYPAAHLFANPEIGVNTTEVKSATAADTTYTALTFTTFTPTKRGVVIIRLHNLTNNSGGIVYWDSLNIS